jgi:glycerophosphoryl diester phosphodiesterase
MFIKLVIEKAVLTKYVFVSKKVEDFSIIGHRGYPTLFVENTIDSFDNAIKMGANSIELDICVSNDNKVFAWHDWDPDNIVAIARQIGQESYVKYRPHVPDIGSKYRKNTHELSLDEIRKNFGYKLKNSECVVISGKIIPELKDVLEWSATKEEVKTLYLDIKVPANLPYDFRKRYIDVIINEICLHIKTHSKIPEIVLLAADDKIMELIKSCIPINIHACLDVILPIGLLIDVKKFSTIKEAIKYRNTYASVGKGALQLYSWTTYQRLINHDMKYRKQNQNNIKVISWTINNKKEMESLIKMGVNGIMTDFPDILNSIYQSKV